jgi:ABC-type transport system involved in multi-copper enzyme maturation permease subunit
MTAVLRAELLKQRSTRTNLGLFATMLGLVLLAEVLHGFGLPAENLDSAPQQLQVLAPGVIIGTLLAALLGAMSITGEIRHGTIRPTLLVTPERIQVITAKVWASMLAGAGFGLAAGTVAVSVSTAALRARGITTYLDLGDYVLPLFGGAAAAALWAAIGVGVGAIVRNQVATLVGLCAWLLFVENLLLGDLADLNVGRFLPGAAAAAISGQEPATPLLAPAVALALLALYAAAAVTAGCVATNRRDTA